jgi:hypothetical protein
LYWRAAGPIREDEALYSLASLLIFVWLLTGLGVVEIGMGSVALLAAATVLIAVAALRRIRQ